MQENPGGWLEGWAAQTSIRGRNLFLPVLCQSIIKLNILFHRKDSCSYLFVLCLCFLNSCCVCICITAYVCSKSCRWISSRELLCPVSKELIRYHLLLCVSADEKVWHTLCACLLYLNVCVHTLCRHVCICTLRKITCKGSSTSSFGLKHLLKTAWFSLPDWLHQ